MKIDPFTTIDELPIPPDVQPTALWPSQLLELAAHIGPYDALRMIEVIGGQFFRIPKNPEKNRLSEIVGKEKAATISFVYGGEKIDWPLAQRAVHEAKRGPVLKAIREGRLTIQEAVPILRMTRKSISHLINQSDEGTANQVWIPVPTIRRDTRQLDMFDD